MEDEQKKEIRSLLEKIQAGLMTVEEGMAQFESWAEEGAAVEEAHEAHIHGTERLES